MKLSFIWLLLFTCFIVSPNTYSQVRRISASEFEAARVAAESATRSLYPRIEKTVEGNSDMEYSDSIYYESSTRFRSKNSIKKNGEVLITETVSLDGVILQRVRDGHWCEPGPGDSFARELVDYLPGEGVFEKEIVVDNDNTYNIFRKSTERPAGVEIDEFKTDSNGKLISERLEGLSYRRKTYEYPEKASHIVLPKIECR